MPLRLLLTADIHYNHPKSRRLADELIDAINAMPPDAFEALLLVGDTGVADGTSLEECLRRFSYAGPKLLVPGNHELWSLTKSALDLLEVELPQRARDAGWHWLPGAPYRKGDVAVVGSLGWYDYAFAPAALGIPRRFYEHKVSPGVAAHRSEFAHLLQRTDDIAPAALELVARWNDARFVHLGEQSDDAFLARILDQLAEDLAGVADVPHVLAAVHHVPLAELLPPAGAGRWDFARAYLGSPKLGELLRGIPNLRAIVCGHSHFPAEARIADLLAINIGSGYRAKTFRLLDVG